ncbi:MAG: TonB-dependent receptor [Saprospiraceae bacterium]|nr:TonB-dependent receptor [Saprospiraceae bacterium]
MDEKLCFYFSVFCFSFITLAQQTSIRGNVYDDETGETIIYANVYLDDDTPRTTTDIEGFFSISNLKPGSHELRISFLGYETFVYNFEIKSGQTIYQKILLKTAGVNLQSVDITANKQRRQNETQISKIQVTPKQLKAMPSVGGSADLVQYLQVMPGIISTGDQGGQIFIRGGSPVQNKITLDGLTIINPFHFIGSFSVFETEAIQNVDIHTGGFNAEYGGRISAIVNIKTKDGNRKHLAGHVSANPFMAKALIEGPFFKLRDEKNFSGSFLLTGKNSLIDRTSKVLGGGSKINAFGFNFQDNYINPKVTDLSWNNYGGGLNFRIVPGTSNLILDALFGYSAYDTRITDLSSKERYSTITDFTTNFNFTYFSDTYKFDYGFDINTVHTDFVFNNFFNQTIREFQNTTNLAAYLKFRKNFKRLLLEPGIRVNYYASLGVIVPEPRLSFKYNFTNKFRIKGSAGKYSQNILSTTNDKDVVNYFIGFISSPEETLYSYVEGKNINDKLQKASHAVLGFEYDLNNRIEFNIETYYKNFEQLAVINRNKRKTLTLILWLKPEKLMV